MNNGRLEQENKLKKRIDQRLEGLPYIFEEFYNYMDADNKSYGTCLHYIDYVADFMRYISKDDDEFYKNASVSEIRNYIASLRRRNEDGVEIKNSDSIQAARWSALNTFYNFLVMDDYISINPMSKTKRPKNRKQNEIIYLEPHEINHIIDRIHKEAKEVFVNRDLAIVMLGISTGLRVSAMVAINISDIDFRNNSIRVIEKGNKERIVKFGSNVRNILSQWLLDRNTYFDTLDTDALFISYLRTRMSTDGINKILKKYTNDIDKNITPHSLRKSCATNAYITGTDIRTIASMLGHSSVNTTMKYAAAVDGKRDAAVSALDNLF